ncbi:MAG: hypothetical protein PHR82_08165 [Endomicrobiaceae bacterium]|nr:hypothetical protein [Endomicrobiaceae bacterium]
MKKCFVGLITLLFSSVVYAGLGVDPSKFEIVMPAGEVYEASIDVKSTYDTVVSAKISTKEWKSYSGNSGVTVKDWLIVDVDKVEILPNQSAKVNFKVTPKEGMVGSLSGMLSFSVQKEGETLNVMISVPVYLYIKGTEKPDIRLDNLKIFQSSNTAVAFDISLENFGNVQVRPQGMKVSVLDKKKQLVHSVTLGDTVPVYAGSKRSYKTQFSNVLPKGKYFVEISLKSFDKEFVLIKKFKVLKDSKIKFKF